MKKQLFSAIQKKAFTLLVALVMAGLSVSANTLPVKNIGEAKKADITYQGVKGNYLVFNVNYKNELTDDFVLTIKNEENEILYAKKYDLKPFATNVLLTDIPGNCKLTFSIKAGKKEFTQTFEINSVVKTVSAFEVKGI